MLSPVMLSRAMPSRATPFPAIRLVRLSAVCHRTSPALSRSSPRTQLNCRLRLVLCLLRFSHPYFRSSARSAAHFQVYPLPPPLLSTRYCLAFLQMWQAPFRISPRTQLSCHLRSVLCRLRSSRPSFRSSAKLEARFLVLRPLPPRLLSTLCCRDSPRTLQAPCLTHQRTQRLLLQPSTPSRLMLFPRFCRPSPLLSPILLLAWDRSSPPKSHKASPS